MVGDSITDITLELYNAVLERLPPTPSRFHYVFNLRDLSRVYEGLLRSSSDVIQGPAEFVRLWRNEVCQLAGASTWILPRAAVMSSPPRIPRRLIGLSLAEGSGPRLNLHIVDLISSMFL